MKAATRILNPSLETRRVHFGEIPSEQAITIVRKNESEGTGGKMYCRGKAWFI